MENYVICNERTFNTDVMFVDYLKEDTLNYESDNIFKKHKLKFKKPKIYAHPDYNYVIQLISIKNKDKELFKKCMSDLKSNMLIKGHTNYEKESSDILDKIVEDYNKMQEEKGSKNN